MYHLLFIKDKCIVMALKCSVLQWDYKGHKKVDSLFWIWLNFSTDLSDEDNPLDLHSDTAF